MFKDPFSEEVWRSTYKDHKDNTVEDTFKRVAKAIASAEETEEKKKEWEEKFYKLQENFAFLPGGRISSNAGTEWNGVTFANCFVGSLPSQNLDSIEGIYKVLVDQAKTLKSEGGWGMDFSWLRPRGSFIHGVGVESPGAVKFMELYDKSSEIVTAGSGRKSNHQKAKGKIRKGAMMASMSVTHPDIIEFITAKQTPGRLTKFNMSVNCTDEFMTRVYRISLLEKRLKTQQLTEEERQNAENAIEAFDPWELIFPVTTHPKYKTEWDGHIENWKKKGYPIEVHRIVSVRYLWNLIMESTYNRNEPGVMFLDRANYFNPLAYGENILSTNP